MLTFGFLSKLFGKDKGTAGKTGVKTKPGSDMVRTPLECPACKHVIAKFTPDQGIALCKCGKRFAILDYEPRPLPADAKIDTQGLKS